MNYQKRVHAVARRPTQLLGISESDSKYGEEILRTPEEKLNAFDLKAAILFSLSRKPEAAFYLPYAVQYMKDRRDDWTELSGDLIWLVSRTQEFLKDHDLLDETLDQLAHIFFSGISAYQVEANYKEGTNELILIACVNYFDWRDDFLNQIDQEGFAYTDSKQSLFDTIFTHWRDRFDTPEHSAHFLDFLVQVILNDLLRKPIHNRPEVLALVSAPQIPRQHWQTASTLIEQQAPDEYIQFIKKQILQWQ